MPGDPASIRSAAGVLDGIAGKLAQQLRLVTSMADSCVVGWSGPAANGFQYAVTALMSPMQTMVSSQQTASGALKTFAGQLEGFQTTATQLLGRAQTYQTAVTTAEGQIPALNASVTSAQTAYNTAVNAPAPAHPNFIGPVIDQPLATASQNLQTAQSNLGKVTTAWKGAQKNLTTVQGQANTLNGQAAAAAQTCANTVNSAAQPAMSTGSDNVVTSFLDSPQFNTAAGLLTIPDGLVKGLEDEEGKTAAALQKAQQAEQDMINTISEAGHDLSQGDTAAARSAAGRIMGLAKKTKAALADATSAADETHGAAEDAVTDLTDTWTANLPKTGLFYLSRGLGFSWAQAYKGLQGTGAAGAAADPTAAGATAAEEGLGATLGDNVPVIGSLLATGLTVNELRQGHYLDAAGTAGGFVATVATGTAVVLLVGTPVGWAVLGTVAASTLVGVAVTEGIDHYKGVLHAGEQLGKDIYHAPGNFISGLEKGLNPANWLDGA